MSNFNEKKYHIDNVPVSASDIVEKAQMYSTEYGEDGIFLTSEAAKILRENGHVVGNFSEVKDE